MWTVIALNLKQLTDFSLKHNNTNQERFVFGSIHIFHRQNSRKGGGHVINSDHRVRQFLSRICKFEGLIASRNEIFTH